MNLGVGNIKRVADIKVLLNHKMLSIHYNGWISGLPSKGNLCDGLTLKCNSQPKFVLFRPCGENRHYARWTPNISIRYC